MKKKLKICLDGRRTDKGGIGRLTDETISALLNRNDIELIVITNNEKLGREKSFVYVPYLPLTLDEYLNLPKFLNSLSVSIFISMQFYSPPSIDIPVVSWVHDTWPLEHPEWLPPLTLLPSRYGDDSFDAGALVYKEFLRLRSEKLLFPDNKFLEKFQSKDVSKIYKFVVASYSLNLYRSSSVVTCSHYSKNAICSLFPETENKIKMIYNPVPAFIKHSSLKNFSANDDILHVSKWEPRKNLHNLILAFQGVAEKNVTTKLHLVGEAVNNNYHQEILELINQSSVKNRIIIHGRISDDELGKLYQRASVFVMPSYCEGFSFPAVEALFCGIPVAASQCTALPEVLGKAALYFDPSSVKSIENVLLQLLHDKPSRTTLLQNVPAQKEFLNKHDFSRSIVDILM